MIKEQFYLELGSKIRGARKSARKSQSELADALNLSRTSMTNIECGRQAVTAFQLFAISEYLSTDAADLLPDSFAVPVDDEVETLPPRVGAVVQKLLAI